MQVVLVMFKNDGSRRSFSLHKPVTVLGRREDCDVRIPLSEISRKHCRLLLEDEALRIEDMGSSNGTFVNGQRVQEASLGAGDTLKIGPVAFVVQLDGIPVEDEIVPVATGTAAAVPKGGKTSHLEPTAVTQIGEAGAFDPSVVLDGPNDSGALEALENSALAHDIAADLERVNQRAL